VANVDTLDLAAGNVEHSNGRVAWIVICARPPILRVHVCGDAVPISPQLSPIATYEGDIVGRNIVEGPKYSPNYESIATSVYTVPALAAVGLTEAAANQRDSRSRFIATTCRAGFPPEPTRRLSPGRRSSSTNPPTAYSGAHFVGHAGEELVNIFGFGDALWHHRARSRTTSTPTRRFPPTSSTCCDAVGSRA